LVSFAEIPITDWEGGDDILTSIKHRKKQQMGGVDEAHPDCEFTFGLDVDIDFDNNSLTSIDINVTDPFIDPELPSDTKKYYHDMLARAAKVE